MTRLHDPSRLAAVRRIGRSEDESDARFDRVVRLARSLFDVPVVAINLVDDHQQLSIAQVGLDSPVRPTEESICAAAVESDAPIVLPDATQDPVFRSHPAVTGEDPVVFYAGRPLRSSGEVVGTLCLADAKPHHMSEAELRLLGDLAAWVEQELDADQERQEALEVQRRLLPRRGPDVPGLRVAGTCLPARTVGGDFYDWQELGDRLQVVVADVMGKGMTAAVIAAGVRALLRGTSPFNSLATSVTRAATDSQGDLDDAGTFVTLFGARVDAADGSFEYVDAGHGLALVLAPDGQVRRLRSSGGLPLGAVPGDSWEASSDSLAPGETLLVVSDGVLDAFPEPEAALRAAAELAALSPDPEKAVQLVTDRVAESVVTDDVTVVAIHREVR